MNNKRGLVRWRIMANMIPILLKLKSDGAACMVEIGMGESTPVFLQFAERHKIILYSCDINKYKALPFKNKTKYHQVYICTSFEFMDQFDGTPVMVFLDGSHDYDIVKREFQFFFSCLVTGGLIFIHDTLPPNEDYVGDRKCGTVYKLRQELELDTSTYDILTWPYTASGHGLTMILKKEENRPYYRR